MDPSLIEVHDTVVKGIGEMADFFGFSSIMGHLYGALLMSPTPLSLDRLEELVGKSKASVSLNIRALERWGMVREVWVKGDRKKYYQAETDFWKIAVSILQSRERREVELAIENLDENIAQLNEAAPALAIEDKDLAAYYLERSKELRELFGFALLAIDLVLSRISPPGPDVLQSLQNTLMKSYNEKDGGA